MNQRTFGWCYKTGLIIIWPLVCIGALIALVLALVAAPFFIPFATVSRNADGALELNF